MKTSAQWWSETKQDNMKLIAWLKKQYYGELSASERIYEFVYSRCTDTRHAATLKTIAAQERLHALWVGDLLTARSIEIESKEGATRYWKEVEGVASSFELAAAVAALAENMRLERIRVIAADQTAPEDIRSVFEKILPQEVWHEQAFREMTNQDSIDKVTAAHKAGVDSIGLITVKEVL
jgi:rubrerythrin